MPQPTKEGLLGPLTGGYRSLKWRIVAVLLLAAALPLLLSGFGSWVVFGDLLERKSLEVMQRSVEHHAGAIEAHLAEMRHLLEVVSENNGLSDIANPDRLKRLLINLNQITDQGFVDLGVIDGQGNHLAYVGPYDLQARNYREADWFREVLVLGQYVSDVFLGYRQVPHCVVAVRSAGNGDVWVLRATINSAQFDKLVKTPSSVGAGKAFIVNRDGLYQTTPQNGQLLDTSLLAGVAMFDGLREERVETDRGTLIRVMTWIQDTQWLLVVEQELASVQAPVDQAIARGAYVVLAAVLILILTAVMATWHLTRQIEKVTAEREELSRAFVRSAKLASIGELTTGLAHEINNPLAIISAEQTNIADIIKDREATAADLDQALESVKRCQNQVRRCGAITQKLLQFGRSSESRVEPTDLNPRLRDITSLMDRQAAVRNVTLTLHVDDDLPPVLADPIEIEQVVVNLINNAFDAMSSGGEISIRAELDSDRVLLEVADSGSGISPKDIDRVFEPFFTTKPVGKGTGLGLSVCYGIVRSWGGEIEISSQMGQGTAVRLILPFQAKVNP